MEKIIIISPDNDTPLTFLNLCINEESVIRLKTPAYLCVLGLVNQMLGDKANAKEIVAVDYHNTGFDILNSMELPTEDDIVNGKSEMDLAELQHITRDVLSNGEKVYRVTYLESEMIANKDDLKKAWVQGESLEWLREKDKINYRDTDNYFSNWFNENF